MLIKVFLLLISISFSLSIEYEINSNHNNRQNDEHDLPIKYEFGYSVHDEHTGDIKSQQESRNGYTVQGRYELIDSDGYRRIVEYTADKQNGFNAVVHREPTDIKIPFPIQKQKQKIIVSNEGGFHYPTPFASQQHPDEQRTIIVNQHQPHSGYHVS